MKMQSSAFADRQSIPVKYTGDGENVSPPLSWEEVPQGTKSLVLIADDPDAPGGVFTHWLVYNIPPYKKGMPEGIADSLELGDGSRQGSTSYGRTGYCGPHPPPGRSHRYYFSLYALDEALDLKPGASKQQLAEAMQTHILALTQLMGTYGREEN